MKKLIIMIVVVGVLLFGTVWVAGEMSEDISFEDLDVSEVTFEDPWGNTAPCGGGGGGPGDVPG
jgi:hypothetical protein